MQLCHFLAVSSSFWNEIISKTYLYWHNIFWTYYTHIVKKNLTCINELGKILPECYYNGQLWWCCWSNSDSASVFFVFVTLFSLPFGTPNSVPHNGIDYAIRLYKSYILYPLILLWKIPYLMVFSAGSSQLLHISKIKKLCCSNLSASTFPKLKLIKIVILWVYYTIPFDFSLFRHFWSITFHLFKLLNLAKCHWRGFSTRNGPYC